MAIYKVNVKINLDTRTWLQNGHYSMYVFKGVQAGGGAISAVWQKIDGSQLYGQETNTITWAENFYIGETQVQMESGATITGTTPYDGSGTSPAAVSLGRLYTFGTTGWQANPTDGPSLRSFAISNLPPKTNNFYVSQEQSGWHIVVQNLGGAGGLGMFEPLERIATILTSEAYNTGELIVQIFSPGLIALLSGTTPTVSVEFDKDKGWSGPSSQTQNITAASNIYDALVNATA